MAFGVLGAVLTAAPAVQAVGSCGTSGVTGTREPVDHEGSLYYVTTPATYSDATPWPLVIGLHGDEGDPAQSVNYFWREVPDGTFIFVAPKAPNESGSWYEEQESNSAWMDDLLDSLLARYNVDLDRIYLWGLSGGAVFSSRYVMSRQHVFAAVELNMGGSARPYQEPEPPACKIPARFVVSPDDFLRENALGFYDQLIEHGHEAVWVDADCSGHCFDQEQAGPVARDWLLSHTLCGNVPSPGCDGTASGGGSGGGAGGEGATGGSDAAAGAPSIAGTSSGGGVAGGSGGAPGSAPEASAGDGSLPPASSEAQSGQDGGCACASAGRRHGALAGGAWLLVLAAVAVRRRRSRRVVRRTRKQRLSPGASSRCRGRSGRGRCSPWAAT